MLSAKNIEFEYGNTQVLRSTSFSVSEGEKIALVGPNGVGKSTLLKIMGDVLQPSSGNILHPKNLNIGYMPQEIDGYQDMTGADFLSEITGVSKALSDLEAATAQYAAMQSSASQDLYQEAYERVESLQAYTLSERITKPLARVGLETSVLDKKISELSGGQKTKLALSAILLSNFDIFLLDEPTNNLDMLGLNILEDFIKKSGSAFVMVSHDRWFIKSTCKKVAELLPSGDIKLYTLGYDEYIQSRRKELESAEQAHEDYTEEKKRLEVSARDRAMNAQSAANNSVSSDNDKVGTDYRKEKAANTYAKAASAISTRLDQLHKPDKPVREINLNFRFTGTNVKLPPVAATVNGAVVEFGSVVLGPYSLVINTGQKIVIIGPNAGGKSSFIKLLAGVVKPTGGSINISNGMTIGYIDQDFSFREPNKSVLDNIIRDTGSTNSEIYNLLARFNIKKEKADSLPHALSPGQRVRALLAGVVAQGANLLILDEPTNHLDIPASNELQSALKQYDGTIVVVTHDRELIEALGDKKIVVIDKGKILTGNEEKEYINQSNIN